MQSPERYGQPPRVVLANDEVIEVPMWIVEGESREGLDDKNNNRGELNELRMKEGFKEGVNN